MMLRLSVLLCVLEAVAGYNLILGSQSYSTDPLIAGTYPALPRICPVTIYLYRQGSQESCTSDEEPFGPRTFNPQRNTYIIIHGMRQGSNERWLSNMCQAILDNEPANCFLMDWESCSWDFYIQQITNIVQLGETLRKFIYKLQQYGCDPQRITLMGMDLGAYIAGKAGMLTKSLGCIIALDPSGAIFEGQGHRFLNRDCASFVQAFHTSIVPYDLYGFGIGESLGDVDCFINGGSNMPECPAPKMSPKEVFCLMEPVWGPIDCPSEEFVAPDNCSDILGTKEFSLEDIGAMQYDFYCSHYQAANYFMMSVRKPEQYMGQQCATLQDCMSGNATSCASDECRQLGFFAKPLYPRPTNSTMYYLKATALPLLGPDPPGDQ